MDGGPVCCNGVDIAVYIAGNDSQYPNARIVVYLGGGIGVHNWGDILFMAPNEVFACRLAPVCNRGQCVLLLCRIVRVYFGFVVKPACKPVFYLLTFNNQRHRLFIMILFKSFFTTTTTTPLGV